jgi:hypothetical protein
MCILVALGQVGSRVKVLRLPRMQVKHMHHGSSPMKSFAQFASWMGSPFWLKQAANEAGVYREPSPDVPSSTPATTSPSAALAPAQCIVLYDYHAQISIHSSRWTAACSPCYARFQSQCTHERKQQPHSFHDLYSITTLTSHEQKESRSLYRQQSAPSHSAPHPPLQPSSLTQLTTLQGCNPDTNATGTSPTPS